MCPHQAVYHDGFVTIDRNETIVMHDTEDQAELATVYGAGGDVYWAEFTPLTHMAQEQLVKAGSRLRLRGWCLGVAVFASVFVTESIGFIWPH